MILTISTIQTYVDTAGYGNIHDTLTGKVSPYMSQRVAMAIPLFNNKVSPVPSLPLMGGYASLRLNRVAMHTLLDKINYNPFISFVPLPIDYRLVQEVKTVNANYRMPPWRTATFPPEFPKSQNEWESHDWLKASLIWLEDWLTYALRQSFETYIVLDARDFYPSDPLEYGSF